jgi:AcrR family transcriptional regulator
MNPTQSRSQLTLAAIVDTALSMAAADGLESLTIGEVAKRLGLSKSGVFSRVGSREQLQALVLQEYDRRFVQDVLVPALREPRGLPRLNALMQRWLDRAQRVEVPQGCIYCAGAFEYDDRVGPVRELLLDGVRRWRVALKRTVVQAIDEGHLAAGTDADQLVFEMDALFTGAMRDARFLGDARALQRAAHTWQWLVADRQPSTAPARRRRT